MREGGRGGLCSGALPMFNCCITGTGIVILLEVLRLRCILFRTAFTISYFYEVYKTTVHITLKCNNSSAVSAKPAEMQFTPEIPKPAIIILQVCNLRVVN